MDIEASYNFREITEALTTSGSVPPDALKVLGSRGYEAIVNLLPDTSEYAILNEQEAVESQGIEYIYIPVDFKQPTVTDFKKFSDALDRIDGKKIHLHCAANYRVSAFYALYAVDRGLWSADQAMQFVHSIWQPVEHPVWSEFVANVLAQVSTQK